MIGKHIAIDKYIQNKGLPRVDSPDRKSPTGLFSTSIFGVTNEERRVNSAYIALNTFIVRPLCLETLKRISRKIFTCATTKTPFVFIKKVGIVEKSKYDESMGEILKEGYGPMFLYDIWDNLDKKQFEQDTGSHINKEMKFAVQKYTRDEIFTRYQWVMAVAYREEPEEDSAILQNEINQYLVEIIKYSNVIENNSLGLDLSDLQVLIQNTCLKYYQYLKDRFTGPKGAIRKQLMARNVVNSGKLTILPPVYKSSVIGNTPYDIKTIGVPLYHVINLFKDFFIKFSKDLINHIYELGHFGDTDRSMLDIYDNEYLTHLMENMEVQHTRVQPFQAIQNDGTFKPLVLPFEVDLDENGNYVLETKPLSNMEFFYIVATKFIDVHKTKSCAVTRYPTDSTLSTQTLHPYPTTLLVNYLRSTKVLDMEFDEYYPYVNDNVRENYYKNIFEQAARMAQATVASMGGDYDGDSVSLKPIITKEGRAEADRIQNTLFFNFDYAGNFRKEVGKDGKQTMYSLTREPRNKEKPKEIPESHDLVQYLLTSKEFDTNFIYAYFSTFDPKKKPELNVYDTVKIKLGKKKPITTTIGRLILNKVLFSDIIFHDKFEFLNEVVYGGVFERALRNIMYLIIDKELPPESMNTVISHYNEAVLRLASLFNSSVTQSMISPDEEFTNYRDKVIGAVEKEVKETGDIEKLEKAEADVIEFAKKKFKEDDMSELYESKNKASWTNDFKATNIGMGALPSLTGGKAAIVTQPLAYGMKIEDLPALTNTAAMGAYSRGCQTANGGALYKQITNAFGAVKGYRGDCGNNHTIEITINDKYDSAIGKYIVDSNGKTTKITLDNIEKYIGKTVKVRDPFFCKQSKNGFCSTCVGETVFDIIGKDVIDLGILTAEAATGVLNMYMKMTHDLKQTVFTIDDLNKYIMPKGDLFEIKYDPIEKKNKIYTKKDLTWRIPALSVESVDSEYVVMAHGSIIDDGKNQYTMVLGTQVTTSPTNIIDVNSKDNDLEKHYQFIYKAGEAIFNDVTYYRKEDNVYKMLNLFLSGNVSNLIPVRYHLETLLNVFKTNKKINASALTFNIILASLARDADDLSKPVRETGNSNYKMVSTIDLVDILGGTFEALFSGDVNRGLFISLAKNNKEQSKETSKIEAAFNY